MGQCPTREANSRSATQEIPSLFVNRKIYYSGHKSPTLLHIMNKINPVHTDTLFKIQLQYRKLYTNQINMDLF
jgi:hypothetical protein